MNEMAAALSIRPTCGLLYRTPHRPNWARRVQAAHGAQDRKRPRLGPILHRRSRLASAAASRADDSAPFEMSVENALKLLGVAEGASFDDILRAKNSIVASCKDDQEAVAQNLTAEWMLWWSIGWIVLIWWFSMLCVVGIFKAAYDMLLMQSLTQRRAGKVVSSSIRYADVKPVSSPGMNAMPQWLQKTVKNAPVSVETPSTGSLGIQAGVYGALMVFTFVNGASTSSAGSYAGADVPGLILATSFGASLYFLTKKNINLGKATIITVGGLVVGAVIGSAVENWLQVDVVPVFGIRSPAAIVSEFILFSQLLVSLYLR